MPPRRGGWASANPAAPGTASSRRRRARPRPRGWARARAGARSNSWRWKARPRRRRAAPWASPSSTASRAAGWCRPRRCWSAAIPASASRPYCCRPSRPWRRVARPASISRAKRRSSRCACARCAWVSPRRRCSWPPPPACATSSPRWTTGEPPAVVVIDSIQTMYLDSLDSAPGTVAQVRACAAELIRLAKRARLHPVPGRPCHQGRPDRRPARARAHGRHGALFRGRARPPVPHPARRQEPLRPDRRDRRVRDDRRRAGGGCQPLGPVPGRTARQCLAAPASSPASRARGRC